MRWKGRRVSTNVEDRRGGGGAKSRWYQYYRFDRCICCVEVLE